MEVAIRYLPEKKLAGIKSRMSFAANSTAALWQQFMPCKKEFTNLPSGDLYSVERYPDMDFFQKFNPSREFEKWAAVEVTENTSIPDGMETLLIPEGLYAVFTYKGKPADAEKSYRYIFETWLPGSAYLPDHRPHFALMGAAYKHDHDDSEEEIWIPVVPK